MKKLSLAILGMGAAALFVPVSAHAQGLFGDLVKRAKQEAERKAREELQRRVTGTPSNTSSNTSSTPSSSSAPASRESGIGGSTRTGPSATTMIGSGEQRRWIGDYTFWRAQGTSKFARSGDGAPHVIATNPYLSPENPLFARFNGLSCTADGSAIVSGDGWANGDYSGTGWWRVAPDGAVAPLVTRPFEGRSDLPVSGNFSIAPDDTFVSAFRDAIFRVTTAGAWQRLAGMTDTPGYADGPASVARFTNPGTPIQDPQGNIWLADKGGTTSQGDRCALRRIAPDGTVTTVIGADRTTCGANPDPGQRIPVSALAWDDTKGELVAAGSVIVGRPAHDMHVSIWRIRPDGAARRVYYTVKAGRSPIGQNMDHIWSTTVDPKGQIHVISIPIPSGNIRRRVLRLNEATGRLVPVTGASQAGYAGGFETPADGPAATANIRQAEAMCFAPNGTLFFTDYHLLRRVDGAAVRTWAY